MNTPLPSQKERDDSASDVPMDQCRTTQETKIILDKQGRDIQKLLKQIDERMKQRRRTP
jgi:hypothetical protein